MALCFRFEWDDHNRSGKPHPYEQSNKVYMKQQVASIDPVTKPQRSNPLD